MYVLSADGIYVIYTSAIKWNQDCCHYMYPRPRSQLYNHNQLANDDRT